MEPSRGRVGVLLEPLTKSETEVLRLVACGLSYAEIAKTLCIGYKTIQAGHMQSIFSKLYVTNRVQAALWAWRHLVSVEDAWDALQRHREVD